MSTYIADLEADGFLDVATTVWCGSFVSLDGKDRKSFSPRDGPDYVKKMLEFMDTTSCLIFHNGYGYDFPLLEKLYGYVYKGEKKDTLVMSRLFAPKRPVPPHCPIKNKPHSIETWGYRVGRGKVENDDWSHFSGHMLFRNQEDVEIGRLVYLRLLEETTGYTWTPALRLTHKLFEVLHKQEEYGWLADREWIHRSIRMLNYWMDRIDRILGQTLPLTIDVEEDVDKETKKLKWVREPFLRSGKYSQHTLKRMVETGLDPEQREVWGPYTRILVRRLSLDKPSEIKDYLLEQGWEPANWNTNDAGERTSPKMDKDDPFDGIEGGVGRLIARYIQCKSRRSILEGWLVLIRPDGRIASSVANLAETGRATHRGIVNVPNGEAFFGKWMRKCFISKPGWVLVGTDSKGCQNRMLAARVGDPFFTNTLINGKKEDGTSIHHVNQKALREVAGLEVTYGKAKNLNYAFMFGASDKKLGRMVGGGPEVGARVREALLSVSAGFQLLVESLVKEWRSHAKKRINKWNKVEYHNGWVTGLDGRPIFVESEHAILVYVLQSDEAIMMATAYIWLYKELSAKYKWGKDFGIVCWYHDEYTVECRTEIAEDIAKISEECIAKAGRFLKIACPHEGDSSIGGNWYDIH